MEMFVQVSENRVIPTRNIVDIAIFPESEGGWDDEMQEPILQHPLRVDIMTNASKSYYDDGGDYPSYVPHAWPYTITLKGEEARTFLDARPTYSPVAGPEAASGR